MIDSRGVPTLVGVNQNVLTPQALPFAWASSVYVFIAEDPDDISYSQEISALITLDFLDPDNTVISSNTQTVKSQRKYKEIPATIALAAQVVLPIQKPGRFIIIATLKLPNDSNFEERHRKYLHVLAPAQE